MVEDVCGWVALAGEYRRYPALSGQQHFDFAIVGGGLTALAAARRLAESRPDASVAILEAKRIAQGASARNSGFAVAVENPRYARLDDARDRRDYHAMLRIDRAGVAELRRLVETHGIDCQWEDTGSIHAAHEPRFHDHIRRHHALLCELGVETRLWQGADLQARLGTPFYGLGVETGGGALLQPALLARGLSETLPGNVHLFEDSPVGAMRVRGGAVELVTPRGAALAGRAVVALNGFRPAFSVARDRVFPLTLTASLTRPLDDDEFDAMGRPAGWGVLSPVAGGATLRLTRDRRLLIRNTAEYTLGGIGGGLAARVEVHREGLRRRFPGLGADAIAHSWSGHIGITRNHKPVLRRIGPVVAVGGYNASGVARSAVYGRLAAELALGEGSDLLDLAESIAPPPRLPPRPFLDLGAWTRMMWEEGKGAGER